MSLYHKFYVAYVERYVYETKKCCQEEVTNLWKEAKHKFSKKEDLNLHIQHEIEQLLRETAERKARSAVNFLKVGQRLFFEFKYKFIFLY